jgi:hypothetical protein
VNLTLSERWEELTPHKEQNAYFNSPHRFNVVPAGRRSGKTELAKRRIVKRAISAKLPWPPRFFCGAPTFNQAKRIYWEDLKALSKGFARRVREGGMTIEYYNGAQVSVLGLDKPERVEGSPWDGCVLDEYGNMKSHVWGNHVRPALSDRNGWCDFIGVPEGRNHYYDLDVAAMVMMEANGINSEWGHFHWKSADILPASEIEAARRDLDELTFQQEYEASFVNFEGRAYYPFQRDRHCGSLRYDPKKPLAVCFDFNVAPGVAVIVQEQELPMQFERDNKGEFKMDHRKNKIPIVGTGIIGEVYIPRNSNTPAVCRKFIQDWGSHAGPVIAYGDATGGASGTAKVSGSDWDLIREILGAHFKGRFSVRIKSANPAERARVNAVNTRLLNGAGEVHLLIDGIKAAHVVKDFEGVAVLKGGSGELDKKKDPVLTHLTDAVGYYIDYEFPVVRPITSIQPLRL